MFLSRLNSRSTLRKKLQSRKGTTMIELLVTLALLGVLTMGIGICVSATGPVLNNSLAISESHLLADTLVKTISGELRYATQFKTLTSSATPPVVPGEVNTFPTAMDFSYTSKQYGYPTCLYNTYKSDGKSYIRIMVGSDGFDLVGSGTYSNLSAELIKLERKRDGSFDVALQIILPDDTVLDYSFTVSPVLSS